MPLSTTRLLLVEDSPVDTVVIQKLLRGATLDVVTAASLSEALEVVRTQPIDEILLDLTLPDSSGLATLAAVRQQTHCAVVVLTGHDDEDTALRALAEGAQDYLIKGKTDAAMLLRALRYAAERCRADEELRASEERFRRLVENGADGITLLDEEGMVIYTSPAITRILGYAPEEVVGQRISSFAHPEDRALVDAAVEKLARTAEECTSGDARYLHRDGSVHHLEVIRANRLNDPAVRALVVNYRDVTDRRQTYQVLDDLRRQYELILNSIADGVHGLDASGRVTFENPAAARMLGWEASELVGRSAHETMHHSHADGTTRDVEGCPIHATLRDGIVRQSRDDRFWRRDGTALRVEYVAAPIRDEHGAVTGAVVVFRDITLQAQMQEQVDRAMRVASLGRVAASVAHEFANILMGISPFVSILQRHASQHEALETPVRFITEAIKRGQRVTRQILDFTSPPSPVVETIDLSAWSYDFAEETKYVMGDRRLEVQAAEPLSVSADTAQITQVMMNLILNARQASPVGGTVTLGAGRGDTFPYVRARVPDPERYAVLYVRDHGAGMTPAVLERIFEPLFTTSTRGGTGLGLAVAYQIVNQHHGEILVETEPGTGSTFYVLLPHAETVRVQMAEGGGETCDIV